MNCAPLVTIIAFVLVGCAQTQSGLHSDRDSPVAQQDVRIPQVLIKEGMRYLANHRYREASRVFNAGLKFSPDNAQLHFLNGLTYHILYLRGEDSRDLAAIGYETALALEPAHYQAAFQLGRLEYESMRYDQAMAAFQRAADIDPQSGEAYLGIAMAAYLQHDLTKARDAISKALRLVGKNVLTLRAEAMIYAAAGNFERAARAADDFSALDTDGHHKALLRTRVAQWRAWHSSAEPGMTPDYPGLDKVLLAQANESSAPAPMPGNGNANVPGMSSSSAKEPAARRWYECDMTPPSDSSQSSSNSGSSSYGLPPTADETLPLPALPAPCKGAGNPQMVVLDVTIVRSEDASSSSYGVNLLNCLTYVFSKSREVMDTMVTGGDNPGRTITVTRKTSGALASTSNESSIAYSLNIANAADARSEILAQPSLLALDRQPSTFFSGRTVTLGISGQAGSYGTISDKPVGVSLSVTPTFIDSETMLISARAARSFIEEVSNGVSFGQTMQTSRNAVTANVVLKFGQTLALSGLSEQEVQRATDGVPILQDIPVLQYLFRNKTTQNFRRSVLVLITPRKPEIEQELAAVHAAGHKRRETSQALSLPSPGNLSYRGNGQGNSYRDVFSSKLFLQYRKGDMGQDDWSEPSRLSNLLEQMRSIAYF